MRILEINNKFTGAGAENVMKTLGACFSKNGHGVQYATYEAANEQDVYAINNPVTKVVHLVNRIDKTLRSHKITNLVVDDPNSSLMKRISLNLRNLIPLMDGITERSVDVVVQKSQPDLVHCHNILPSLAPIFVAKRNDIPVAVTLHGYWPICPLSNRMQIKTGRVCDSKNWDTCNKVCAISSAAIEKNMSRLRHFLSTNVDCIIPVSNYVRDRLIEYSYPEDKIVTIHNGVDTEMFRPSTLPIQPKVIHVGRLSYHKGSHIFLKVAKQLERVCPEIRFILVGSSSGQSESSLNNVEYLEWMSTSELVKLYSTALCVVTPSIWPEPHPLINLEAMASGTPVIASRIAGIEESIVEKKNGFLIDLASEEKMAEEISEKIVYLQENEKERIEMGQDATRHIRENFSLDRMVNDYMAVCGKLIKK